MSEIARALVAGEGYMWGREGKWKGKLSTFQVRHVRPMKFSANPLADHHLHACCTSTPALPTTLTLVSIFTPYLTLPHLECTYYMYPVHAS